MGLSPSDRASLLANLVVIVGAVLAMNGLIFGLGWARGGDRPASALAPPGWVVGAVWTALFALLAVARWRLGGPSHAVARRWVTGLILFCLAYPPCVLASDSMTAGFAYNLATIALAAYVTRRAWPDSRLAAACVLPIVPWVIFATLTIMVDWN